MVGKFKPVSIYGKPVNKIVQMLVSSHFIDFSGISRTISSKNKNAGYRLQISALVPEILKFEKCVKYANEMTDDVIHSTQCYIKSMDRAISVNRPFARSGHMVLN